VNRLRAKIRGLLKTAVVEGGMRGLLPVQFATWLIARLGLRHD
jgi:hypothetical protein